MSILTFQAALIATTLMTIFSYCVGAIRKKKFLEPGLLNDLLIRLKNKMIMRLVPMAGWIIHYLVGLIFIVVYQGYWAKSTSGPSIINCIVLGALSGVIGICGWKLAFHIHPDPPRIDFKEFYAQLFFAHIIFGVGAYISTVWF